jgi:hypothetical protein
MAKSFAVLVPVLLAGLALPPLVAQDAFIVRRGQDRAPQPPPPAHAHTNPTQHQAHGDEWRDELRRIVREEVRMAVREELRRAFAGAEQRMSDDRRLQPAQSQPRNPNPRNPNARTQQPPRTSVMLGTPATPVTPPTPAAIRLVTPTPATDAQNEQNERLHAVIRRARDLAAPFDVRVERVHVEPVKVERVELREAPTTAPTVEIRTNSAPPANSKRRILV